MIRLRFDLNALGGCRLLLAEDSMMIAGALTFFLESYGCSVFKVARCDQILTLIKTQSFDIALLDVTLADGLVYPAAEALLARGIPLLFLSGFSAQHLPESWGRWPVLDKIVDPELIVQRLITLYRDH
ncbi:MAG: hypothetical protein PF501_08580 [Salinisphaera sp.]|jgi:CheY-like chemotaxis protein|nr:hypothetical protein [Salinisphaera sp.]